MMFKSITAHLGSSRVLGLLVVLGSMLFLCTIIAAQAGEVNLEWDANNGEPNLNGYRIYYGEASGKYTSNVDVSSQTSYRIDNLQDGKTYYFVIMAYGYDSNGQPIESNYSNEFSMTIGSSSN